MRGLEFTRINNLNVQTLSSQIRETQQYLHLQHKNVTVGRLIRVQQPHHVGMVQSLEQPDLMQHLLSTQQLLVDVFCCNCPFTPSLTLPRYRERPLLSHCRMGEKKGKIEVLLSGPRQVTVARGRPHTLHLRVTLSPPSHATSPTGTKNSGGAGKKEEESEMKVKTFGGYGALNKRDVFLLDGSFREVGCDGGGGLGLKLASYPVALDGVYGLLAGGGAGAHAVYVLTVGGVAVMRGLPVAPSAQRVPSSTTVAGGLEGRDRGWQGDHIPADLSGPSGPGEWWWWTGWGKREDGWGMREGRERGPHREEELLPDPPEPPPPPPPPMLELLPPGRPPVQLLLLLGGPPGPPPPTWFLWYSMGDVRAVMTICSNRKTLLSFILDRSPPSWSDTMKKPDLRSSNSSMGEEEERRELSEGLREGELLSPCSTDRELGRSSSD
ncbi:hypothetical protein F7725_018748 [Dissostichus mawsoni]|uniref:Uncharacterized protein n=1 Tax=Dissostichus mawsoni TaxID=36200 RepID=A0A7J5XT23_DISMA|nr:hypothetical protein F7725_018748 [Dissostichus mawsoni]